MFIAALPEDCISAVTAIQQPDLQFGLLPYTQATVL